MADAKVIPFDDDRTRNGAQRSGRRRSAGGAGAPSGAVSGQGRAEPKVVRQKVRTLHGAAVPPSAVQAAAGERSGGSVDESHEAVADDGWERRVASGLAFLRRRVTGDYEVDEFGYDKELTDQVLMSLVRPLYENYFRVEVKGIENIPAEGGALVVANHSGTLPLDGLMMQVAVHDNHPAGRHLRLLAADLVFVLPVINELARKAGHTLACTEDAERLLQRGEVVGVMPEGFKGIGKPFSDRYKLQRFGRGGFVSTALKAGVPIVPCSIVGAEEIYPMIGNSRTLARLLGIPYFPITPTFPWLGPLGAVPLPTKWTIQFGEPIETSGYPAEAAEDPMLMFNLTDQVREQIQHTLYKLLVQRRSVFF
ncbi:lysophospholipid acyltransferase family protein [Streptomyces albipurpureus]|uniref:Acyltransferase family protein n=1 Tax=Streptomyces albipurpureus TaxID=2897419 RepID=A0ABT0V3S5_9ACTN|nr:lysophospholipid acyltransferase family protein [Streptomyces sp. CWNU-1]MCM2394031.1 acyltransferase family protein [Streptomyces sp. CWNU-1]